MPNPAPGTWFDTPDRDGVCIAAITDDLHVELNTLGTVTICGWDDSRLQLDFDDVLDVSGVLAEAVQILGLRGHRSAYQHRGTRECER